MKCEESLCPALVSFKTELWEYEWNIVSQLWTRRNQNERDIAPLCMTRI